MSLFLQQKKSYTYNPWGSIDQSTNYYYYYYYYYYYLIPEIERESISSVAVYSINVLERDKELVACSKDE